MIYAFDKGPVIQSVYRAFKDYPRHITLPLEVSTLATASRIRFAEDGDMKLASINEILDKYSEYDENTLVELTHKEGGAWDRTDKSYNYAEIKFIDIVKYDKDLV